MKKVNKILIAIALIIVTFLVSNSVWFLCNNGWNR